jgi:hypothetical protein
MMSSHQSKDPDKLKEEAAKSLQRAHDLVDELKSVQEYERKVLGANEPPLFRPAGMWNPTRDRRFSMQAHYPFYATVVESSLLGGR